MKLKNTRILTTLLATSILAGSATMAVAADWRGGSGFNGGGRNDGRGGETYSYEISLVRDANVSVQRASPRDPRAFATAASLYQELARRVQAVRQDRERTQLLGLVTDTQNTLNDARASFEHKRARLEINGDQIINLFSRLGGGGNGPGRPDRPGPDRPGHDDIQAARFAREGYDHLSAGIREASRSNMNGTKRALQDASMALANIRIRSGEIDEARKKISDAATRLNLVPHGAGPMGSVIERVALSKAIEKMQDAQRNIRDSRLMDRDRNDHGPGNGPGGPRPGPRPR